MQSLDSCSLLRPSCPDRYDVQYDKLCRKQSIHDINYLIRNNGKVTKHAWKRGYVFG